MIEEKHPYSHCFYCKVKMTEKDIEHFEEEIADYCCDGHMCGCRGLSTEPPICIKCVNKNFKDKSDIGDR